MSPFPRGWPARVGAAVGAIAAAGALADLAALWLAKAGHWGPQVHCEPRVARLILVGSIGARARGGVGRVTAARLVDALKEPGLNLRVWWHLASNLLVHPRSLLHQVKLAGHASVLEDARRVRVPTLLAWGTLDRTMPLDCARRLQACIPGSSLVLGPGSHDWLITHAPHFARMVLERRF